MRFLLISILLTFCIKLSAQTCVFNYWNSDLGNIEFSLKELKDSNIKKIHIVLDDLHLGQSKIDTLIRFTILNDTTVEGVKSDQGQNLRHVYEYKFNAQGELINKKEIDYYIKHPARKISSSNTTTYENGKIVKITRYSFGNSTEYIYEYNLKGLHEKVLINNFTFIRHYYNKNDKLIRTCRYHGFGDGNADSLVNEKSYDERGNLISDISKFSPTFSKNVQLGCTTGDQYHFEYKYDSLNRVIQKTFGTPNNYPIETFEYFPYLEIKKKKWHESHSEDIVYYKRRNGSKEIIIDDFDSKRINYISKDSNLPSDIKTMHNPRYYHFIYEK